MVPTTFHLLFDEEGVLVGKFTRAELRTAADRLRKENQEINNTIEELRKWLECDR